MLWLFVGSLACESVGTIGLAGGGLDDTTTGDRGESSSGADAVMPYDATSTGGDESSSGRAEKVDTTGDETTGFATTDDGTTSEDVKLDAGPGSTTGGSDTDDDTGSNTQGIDCCAPNEEPGCADLDVQSCVCDLDPYCCDEAWDQACANTAKESGCSPCGMDMKLVDDCCTPSAAMGCAQPDIAMCVCATDPYCCLQQWDATCVEKVDELGCGICP